MPHCVIEYSKNIERLVAPSRLVDGVQQGARNSGLFEASHVRSRAIGYEYFANGYPVKHFIHVTLKILTGRSQEQKKKLTTQVLDELEKLGLESISISVEVLDMDTTTYSKKVSISSK